MSVLTSRNQILNAYKNLAAEVNTIQQLMFEDDPDMFETDMDRELYILQFDAKDLETVKAATFYKIISIHNSRLMTHTKELSGKLIPMLMEIGVEGFVIVPHLKMNLFGSNLKHKYKPVKNAFAELSRLLQSSHYDGAIKIGIGELPVYLDIMFWIERCDATVPEFIFFHDTKDRFNFSVCKEGNLHLTEYGEVLLTPELLKRHGWSVVQGSCNNGFTESSKIEGRITAR